MLIFFFRGNFNKAYTRLDHQQNYYRFFYFLTSASRHRCLHACLASDESLIVPASLPVFVLRTLLMN